MKRLGQILVVMVVVYGSTSASAEIHSADILGEWCLVHQSINGHNFETLSVKDISENLKARSHQRYHFIDTQTVEVTIGGEVPEKFTYKISGSKKNRIRIKRWDSFAVKSLTESELLATVYGTVEHRFTRGTCE